MQTFDEKARKIIQDNLYITIATASNNGEPWVSPLYCAFDNKHNFYWISPHKTKHQEFAKENNHVAFVLFDSSMPVGTGEGVYGMGKVHELTGSELEQGIQYIYARMNKNPKDLKDYLGSSQLRIYKLVPEKFWMNDGDMINGRWIDKRVEVLLKK